MQRRLRTLGLLAGLVIGWAGSPALAAPAKGPDVPKQLAAIESAQTAVGAEVARLREQLQGLEARLTELSEELRQEHEAAGGSREHQKEMREEVRGLYVETSSVKGDIAELGRQVQSVSTSFGNFRYSSGVLIAILIVLQVVAVALVLRGRS